MRPRPQLFTLSAVLLWLAALVALVWQVPALRGLDGPTAVLVVGLALFCIGNGFSHPHYGYVSFDRVAQVGSLLVLGPVPAALLNGLASLLFPLKRYWRGEGWRPVLDSALANSGMMVLLILASGQIYRWAGGEIPLRSLQRDDILPLLLLALSLHSLNELVMGWFIWLRGGDVRKLANRFTYAVEFFSILMAFFVAVALPRAPLGEALLLLLILGSGMVVLRQLAVLRQSLSRQVAERTRELEAKTAELDRLAREDTLTCLPNRRTVDAWLQVYFDRPDGTLVLGLLDVDRFKQINDHHSHAKGDEVLYQLGRQIRACLQPGDLAGRYGGDEFLLCLKRPSLAAARQSCERLLSDFAATHWTADGAGFRVTASIGLTAVREGETQTQALARADERLYRAKRQGRDRVCADDDLEAVGHQTGVFDD